MEKILNRALYLFVLTSVYLLKKSLVAIHILGERERRSGHQVNGYIRSAYIAVYQGLRLWIT